MNNTLARRHPVAWEVYDGVALGLEKTFARLDALRDNNQTFPPYNIRRVSETETILEVALAGYKKENLTLAVENNVLTLSSVKAERGETPGEFVHKGVAFRSFAKNFQLGDNTIVRDVTFTDGLLTLSVVIEIPEEQKRKVLEINSNSSNGV